MKFNSQHYLLPRACYMRPPFCPTPTVAPPSFHPAPVSPRFTLFYARSCARQIRIRLLTSIPVQVDGEPWIQPAGQVVILRSALKVSARPPPCLKIGSVLPSPPPLSQGLSSPRLKVGPRPLEGRSSPSRLVPPPPEG